MIRTLPFLAFLLLLPVAPASGATIDAHRGGPLVNGQPRYPEETLAAMQAAADLGVNLEMDARLTADDKVVLLHDATLDRTTNCTGELIEKTLAQLADCEVDMLGSPGNDLPTKAAPVPQPIATLADVLALAKKTGSTVVIETNNYPTDSGWDPSYDFPRKVADVILASGIKQSKVILQSFVGPNIDAAKEKLPGAQTALIALKGSNESALDNATGKYDWIFPSFPLADGFVNDAHAAGLRVSPYTVNKVADMKTAFDMGVDSLITDDPLAALKLLDTKKPKVKVAFLTKTLERMRNSGFLKLRITVDEPAEAVYTVRVGGIVLASGFADGKQLKLPLTKTVRSFIKGKKKALVAVKVKATDRALNKSTKRASVVLD